MLNTRITARDAGHYIIDKCSRDGRPINNDYLQKILYNLQLTYCAGFGELLFEDEFSVSPYGPIMLSVWDEFNLSEGSRPIYVTYDEDWDAYFDDYTRAFIDEGIESLREMYPFDLVKLSMSPESPWAQIYNDDDPNARTFIPNTLVIEQVRSVM